MAHNVQIHDAQTAILKELLFKECASFSELQKQTPLDSDHFKFHIKRLVDIGFVNKDNSGSYRLSAKGKEYANKIDTENGVIERQPKCAVIIVLQDKAGRVLAQERKKHPYFGFWGYPGGKIRWGETIVDAAHRELLEETGLAADLVYRGVYHERVQSAETNEIIEDKIFHVVHGKNPTGDLLKVFEGGENMWLTVEDLNSKLKKYKSTDIETNVGLGKQSFIEELQTYSDEEF